MTLIINARDLTKKYGTNTVLSNINVKFSKGDCIGIIGPNGSGKTTFLKILAGMISPTSGHIFFENETGPFKLKNPKKHIGMVLQDESLDVTLNVFENLVYFGRYGGMSKNEATLRANTLLKSTELKAKKTDAVESLSGGTKKKISILRCLMNSPEFILMDESANNLDLESKQWLHHLIKTEKNKGFVISSHSIEEIDYLCNYVMIFLEGSILIEGEPKALIQKYLESFALEFKPDPNIDQQTEIKTLLHDRKYFYHNGHYTLFSNKKNELRENAYKIFCTSITFREASLKDLYLSLTQKKDKTFD